MMSNKNFTASVSGNRTLLKDFNINKLKETFNKLIKIANINTFLVGMAVGFDTVCFNVLEEIRKTEDIKIVACIPCENQDYNFSLAQKKEYNRMLLSSDEKIYIAKEYTKACMLKRNRYLVDNSSVLVAYIYKTVGGSYYTAKYAVENDKEIIYLK
jgi:uncharacterized phage-like protein YoqJ